MIFDYLQKIETNYVTLKGKVVREFEFNHCNNEIVFLKSEISIKRNSGYEDIIPIIINEIEYSEIKNKIGKNSNVLITGQFRSYNDHSTDKRKLILYVYIETIELVDDLSGQYNNIEDINEIKLDGYICKKPNRRMTPKGREIADTIIAIKRQNDKSDYLPCIFWGKNAKKMENKNVGDKISINGRIQSRTYNKCIGNEIQQMIAYEVSVCNLI